MGRWNPRQAKSGDKDEPTNRIKTVDSNGNQPGFTVSPLKASTFQDIFPTPKKGNAKDEGDRIRVGRDYQATIPDFIPRKDRKDLSEEDHHALEMWKPSDILSEEKIVGYVSEAAKNHRLEQCSALGLLYWHNYDIEKATKDLSKFSNLSIDNQWEIEDKILFEHAFQTYGKSFDKIQGQLREKPMSSIIRYYYDYWKPQQRRRGLKGTGMIFMEHQNMAVGSTRSEIVKKRRSRNRFSMSASVTSSSVLEVDTSVTPPDIKKPRQSRKSSILHGEHQMFHLKEQEATTTPERSSGSLILDLLTLSIALSQRSLERVDALNTALSQSFPEQDNDALNMTLTRLAFDQRNNVHNIPLVELSPAKDIISNMTMPYTASETDNNVSNFPLSQSQLAQKQNFNARNITLPQRFAMRTADPNLTNTGLVMEVLGKAVYDMTCEMIKYNTNEYGKINFDPKI